MIRRLAHRTGHADITTTGDSIRNHTEWAAINRADHGLDEHERAELIHDNHQLANAQAALRARRHAHARAAAAHDATTPGGSPKSTTLAPR